MDVDESWRFVDQARATLADLALELRPEEWQTPSLCEGWTVRDVLAHLSMAATMPTREVLVATLRARGSFDRMIHDTAVQRATRSRTEIVADLRGIIGSRRLAPTTFWRDPLLDILVHGQDIVRPLGRVLPAAVEPARVAADWAWQRRFPFFPARRLTGVRLIADDVDWERGRGEPLRGPVLSLLLLSTGRWAALDDLHGPGLTLARTRAGIPG